MLALCLMLLVTYYALNYAGIIGRCLVLEFRITIYRAEIYHDITIYRGY